MISSRTNIRREQARRWLFGRLPGLEQKECCEEHYSADQHELYAEVHHVWNPVESGRKAQVHRMSLQCLSDAGHPLWPAPVGPQTIVKQDCPTQHAGRNSVQLYNICGFASLQEMDGGCETGNGNSGGVGDGWHRLGGRGKDYAGAGGGNSAAGGGG